MRKLDDQLRQLAHEIADAAPVAGDPPVPAATPANRRSRRTTSAAAAVVVVVVVVAGIVGWRVRTTADSRTIAAVGADEGQDPLSAGVAAEPTPSASGTPTGEDLDSLGSDQWPYPDWLPDGLEFEYAFTTPDARQIRFTDDGNQRIIIDVVSVENLPTPSIPAKQLDIAGSAWTAISELFYVKEINHGWVQVSGQDMNPDLMIKIIGSLALVGNTGLPRPPIDYTNGLYTDVASSIQNGRHATLAVTTDGVFYALRTTWGNSGVSGIGCCSALRDGEFIQLTGGTGRAPTENGPPAGMEGLINGIVRRSVASIEIRLKDGTVLNAQPQDLDDSFPVNFLFAAIPDPDDDFFSTVDAVVALDSEGNELGRATH